MNVVLMAVMIFLIFRFVQEQPRTQRIQSLSESMSNDPVSNPKMMIVEQSPDERPVYPRKSLKPFELYSEEPKPRRSV